MFLWVPACGSHILIRLKGRWTPLWTKPSSLWPPLVLDGATAISTPGKSSHFPRNLGIRQLRVGSFGPRFCYAAGKVQNWILNPVWEFIPRHGPKNQRLSKETMACRASPSFLSCSPKGLEHFPTLSRSAGSASKLLSNQDERKGCLHQISCQTPRLAPLRSVSDILARLSSGVPQISQEFPRYFLESHL